MTIFLGDAGTWKSRTRLPSMFIGKMSLNARLSVVCCDISCFSLFRDDSLSLNEVPIILCLLSQTPKTIHPHSRSLRLASLLSAEKYLPSSSMSKFDSAFLNSTTSFSECSHSLLNISIICSILNHFNRRLLIYKFFLNNVSFCVIFTIFARQSQI